METLSFYYHKPKIFLVTALLFFAVAGLLTLAISFNDLTMWLVCLGLLLPVLLLFYFCIVDAFLPAINNKPVFIIDNDGITDVISWGLIRWSNIDEVKFATIRSNGISHKEIFISLKDVQAYESYRLSWWIRFKMKRSKLWRGVSMSIIMDIDALEGDPIHIFNIINERQKQFLAGKR